MSNFEKILPEACYPLANMTFKDVEKAFKENMTVVGYVEAISQANETLSIRLGDDIVAYLPFDEATMYPLTYSQNNPEFPFPLQVGCLKEKNICAKIKNIKGHRITLSRKDNMLEVLELIKDATTLPFNVTATRTKIVFGDVGQGVQARISVPDLCKARIRSTAEICKKGDSFFVKVLNLDELGRFNVSYKDTFPEYNPDSYTPGEMITGVINEPVDSNFSGFFVNVSPQVAGILDYQTWHPILHYGDTVECVISSASKKGLHLKLSKVISRQAR
ncbi:MAG: hypothetical protein IKK84_02850 [Clostridia bacterium]|nr:hypothetical protein [Clostridia bacterium]